MPKKTTAPLSTNEIAERLRSAVEQQDQLYFRVPYVEQLLAKDTLVSRADAQSLAKQNASSRFAAKIDKLVALQLEIDELFAAERKALEQQVIDLTFALLKSIDVNPRPSRRGQYLPAWLCTLPHWDGGSVDVDVLYVQAIKLKNGKLHSLRLSVNSGGTTVSWTIYSEKGKLVSERPFDF